jgi:hypothetical protein
MMAEASLHVARRQVCTMGGLLQLCPPCTSLAWHGPPRPCTALSSPSSALTQGFEGGGGGGVDSA